MNLHVYRNCSTGRSVGSCVMQIYFYVSAHLSVEFFFFAKYIYQTMRNDLKTLTGYVVALRLSHTSFISQLQVRIVDMFDVIA